tara:strand:+ start:477 stop:902 length:426 start_codon:yes stop_codon:yes gene_type:complete
MDNKIYKYKNEEDLMRDTLNLKSELYPDAFVIHPAQCWDLAVEKGIASQSAFRYYFIDIMRAYGLLQMQRYMSYYEMCTQHLVEPLSPKDWDEKYCPTDHRLSWKHEEDGRLTELDTDNFWYPYHKAISDYKDEQLKKNKK